jgi:hypothetical protein
VGDAGAFVWMAYGAGLTFVRCIALKFISCQIFFGSMYFMEPPDEAR